ncbi:cyclic nucleotide-binding domain-containing protein [Leptospira sp. GIMC2001]|uniref:cyclic nucleotide-binding domain-containing protein n=1 Tax=Leptospira sp. GIMC2001 TaxID=1513297 RepID=UPI0023497B81|nr:cyclic nucleotide-binding domain-containing protein [Leptospira sp. GIMC2001]WCL49031.1 cyclic nucleotide-binding domain-containing protein [Leptospira sp. GIMC2001]
MQNISVTPGVSVVIREESTILFGCPPEVIKHLINKGIPSPDIIVLPDTPYRFDVLQNCTEFPLYSFLFVDGNFFKGKKLTIIGTPLHLKANRKLLRLTLLGPTPKEYRDLGDNPWFEELHRESRAMAIKDKNGKELTIDDFIDFVPFEKGKARLSNGIVIEHIGTDRFSIDNEKIDISFNEPQEPPYDLRNEFVSMTPIHFGTTVLGGASGFIADKPCSSILLHYNAEHMLVDCPPYLKQALNARGLSNTEIRSLYLTHIHDDHCNIFPLLRLSNKIKLLSTKEIFWMAMMKLSLQTLMPIEDISEMFDFVEVKPYGITEFYGLSIETHYTVHSIPTIGATFRMSERGKSHSIVFIGDNKSFPDINDMVNKGIVRKEKFDILRSKYTDQFDLLFADGGKGILHGDPRDALGSKADRIVFMHLEKLPPEFDATFSHAVAGKRYTIIPANQDSYLIKTMQILNDSFPKMSHHWGSALMNNFHIVTANSGDVVFKQNEISNGQIYILLAGSCSVMYHDGEKLTERARKEAGDFVGEMAVLDENKVRSASIVASTPVVLCAIDEKLFHEFIISENRTEEMRHLWKARSEIEKFLPFSEFHDNVNDRIARHSKRLFIPAGETVVAQGSKDQDFYIVISGEFSVRHNDIKVKELRTGDMFGEYASIDDAVRNATVTSTQTSTVLKIGKDDIRKIVESAPIFHFSIREIMIRRSRELKKLAKMKANGSD